MTLTLDRPESAAKLSGLKWVCSECLTVNRPMQIDCVTCGKQRWYQLGISEYAARVVAQQIVDEGHGA
jgi:hypothetical protein